MKKQLFKYGSRVLLLTALLFAGCASDKTSDIPKTDPGSSSTTVADQELKDWMVDYMKKNYLWNEALANVTPDYTLSYDAFLTKILVDIAAQGDINHDDGHWENGERKYFYSNILRYEEKTSSTASVTRGTREMTEGSGITSVFVYYRDDTAQNCVFVLGGVAPTSPAGQAGLKRGDTIEKVGGEWIGTDPSQYNAAFNRMVYPTGEVTVSVVDASGGSSTEVTYRSASYEDNPVWKYTVEDVAGAKVGYLCYDSFNYYYDDELLEAFEALKSERIDELVLDLRYNGGGHVVSSLLLGTFVAGSAHQGEVYMRTTYNADRMASSSESDVYRIGTVEYGSGKYDKVATALGSSLGLDRVYMLCSGSTASASELLINGLRGLGIEVRLIGKTTNGKNVGMESVSKTFDGYEYVFSPITFYSENAVGFKDYGDGFAPDVEVDEISEVVRDWGNPEDGLFALALRWIGTGTKPQVTYRSTRAALLPCAWLSVPHKSLEGMIISRE